MWAAWSLNVMAVMPAMLCKSRKEDPVFCETMQDMSAESRLSSCLGTNISVVSGHLTSGHAAA